MISLGLEALLGELKVMYFQHRPELNRIQLLSSMESLQRKIINL